MNKLIAEVINIQPGEVVSYIQVKHEGIEFRLIKSQLPAWVSVGEKVELNIAEAAICVSKECPGKVSIENSIKVKLEEMRCSESLCELTFRYGEQTMVALITEMAWRDMELELGCEATALIRGVDISIEPYIDTIDTINLYHAITGARTKDAN